MTAADDEIKTSAGAMLSFHRLHHLESLLWERETAVVRMAPDEIMVYTGTAIVPAVTSLACILVLHAVHRRSISVRSSCVVFIMTLLSGMGLSSAFVSAFSHLLHGDGALAIIAAPVTGAIMPPIAAVFAIALTMIASTRDRPSSRNVDR